MPFYYLDGTELVNSIEFSQCSMVYGAHRLDILGRCIIYSMMAPTEMAPNVIHAYYFRFPPLRNVIYFILLYGFVSSFISSYIKIMT